ncbi:MAG: leucine-rich repeat protein [Lachnospiraceae bacterium]|nr:leucine-rich repeat protein [Lachnospiraceae bacterium]
MSKPRRRLSRKFKFTLGITIASLFLISSIIVALLPQKSAEAYDPSSTSARVYLDDSENNVPILPDGEVIYTTGDGEFQFAYMTKANGNNKIAVICGYDFERTLPNGELVIPEKVDGYMKYTDADGTEGGYVAVSISNEALYYPTYKEEDVYVPVLDSNGMPILLYEDDAKTIPVWELDDQGNYVLDSNGDKVQAIKKEKTTQTVLDKYLPCYYKNIDKWLKDSDNNGEEDDLYYLHNGAYYPTTDETHKRIKDAEVNYIANQNVSKTSSGWEVNLDDTKGIFSNAQNIKTLVLGKSILGVGNYAFKNCANLREINFGDGINTIGNYAFADCNNLQSITIPDNAAIKKLGERAFLNCQGLEVFNMPVGVSEVGDSCFEGCYSMKHCNLIAKDQNGNALNMNLTTMGDNVFKDCSALEEIEFPRNYNEDQDVAWFVGCTSLKRITVRNSNMTIKDGLTAVSGTTPYSFKDFQDMVCEEFYLEGPEQQALHNTSTANSFAFKYLDEEKYEKVYNVNSTEDGTGKLVYRVDNQNRLIYFYMDDTVKKVEIPAKIGPYGITKIGSDSFSNKCNITKVIIPSTITEIEAGAFKGSHNLKDVIFNEPINVTYIGDGAFDTQVVNNPNCSHTLGNDPFLSFTGVATKGSAPFDYAMNKNNNINNSQQADTYITFYTGWPTNQEIRYNPDKDVNEVIKVPTLASLLATTGSTYPYLTNEMVTAAKNAGSATTPSGLSQMELDAYNSALNVELPDGVTGIKEGLFSGLDNDGNALTGTTRNIDIVTLTTHGVKEIEPYALSSVTNLTGVYLDDGCEKIGDFAFADCDKLVDVEVCDDLNEFGDHPFADCEELTDVNFEDGGNFTCDTGIIYGLANGKKDSLLEALETRGSKVGSTAVNADELEGVSTVANGAFKDLDDLRSVDFSKSNVTSIPESCFENTPKLYSVILKDGNKNIGPYAFKNSGIGYIEIPSSTNIIKESAFDGDNQQITFYCQDDSPAADFAKDYPNILAVSKPIQYHVYYYDEDATTLLYTDIVNAGTDSKCDVTPSKDGYVFDGWFPEPKNITKDLNTYAKYSPIGSKTYTVRFLDYDDTVLSTQTVEEGKDAVEIKSPERKGYTFVGWRPSFKNITKDTDCLAMYEKEGTATDPNNPNGNNNQNNGSNKTLYTVTVVDGSGSGSYVEGASIIITANNPESGKVFDKWTTEDGVTLLKADMAATYFTMPAKNVTIKATYKTDSSKNNNNNNSSNNGNNNQNGAVKPNTTVSLTKTGFSNNGIASASVTGSSDNFVLKITDSQMAKAEIEDALLTKYDSLDNIKYVAMDISLYNSTGSQKIENNSDLKVSVTLPIPDDLVPYAGNNKVAYVVNGKLVDLNPKFTTINGVPCINFTATHFSPYTIYVDTSNLSSSVSYTPTSTPKTGDGLSIKWIISIGLFAASILFFALSIPSGMKKKKVRAK